MPVSEIYLIARPYATRGKSMSSTMTRHMKPQHLKATRMVGYALTIGDYGGWAAASALFAVHLKPSEIAALSLAALGALEDDACTLVLDYTEQDE